jgi:DNA mismatch repair protein MSH6
MDADVGMGELDLIYMKGTKAHSGFPEVSEKRSLRRNIRTLQQCTELHYTAQHNLKQISACHCTLQVSYGKFAGALVTKGYRVARVEQTETPEMLKERNDSKAGKKDKVVAREMCSIMSKGTRTYCHLDDLSVFESEGGQGGSLLMSIKEKMSVAEWDGDASVEQEEGGRPEMVPEYGICCVDTIIGTITLAQFQDDNQRSRLRTLLTRLIPTEILLEADSHSAETAGTLRLVAPRAAIDVLRGSEMPDASETVKRLQKGNYFSSPSNVRPWPAVLRAVTEGLDDGSSELVMCAIGGAVWQLKRSLIDYEVLSLGKFLAYIPPDEEASYSQTRHAMENTEELKPKVNIFQTVQSSTGLLSSSDGAGAEGGEADAGQSDLLPTRMVLDAVALTNLEVLQNNFDRTEKGSLWAFVNRSKTLFGARLLKDWMCHPLYKVTDIASRAAAVDDLLTCLGGEAESAAAVLKGVPDLERLLARVHSMGLKKKGKGVEDHPDGRAVMYEMPTYNSRKIKDFSDILTGFEAVLKVAAIFEDADVTSNVLKRIVKSPKSCPIGKFPKEEMSKLLQYFRTIFDEKQAKRDGNIRPRPGVAPDYDQAKADIADTERSLENYLKDLKVKTKINDLKYFGSNKDRFQIEVPISSCNKVPAEWTTKSQKKTHRRYWNSTIEDFLATMIEAEDREKEAQKDTLRRVFEK